MAEPAEDLPPGFEPLPAEPAPELAGAAASDTPPGFEPLPSTAEQVLADAERLSTIFRTAQLDKPVDQKASILRLSKDSGAAPAVIEQKYEELKGSWAAAKFDPTAWRAANPELAKLVLEQPHLGTVVMRDPELNVLTKALSWAHDKIYDAFDVGAYDFEATGATTPEESAARVAQQKATQAADRLKRDHPSQVAFTEDNKSRLVKDEGGIQRALVPLYRYLETRQQLELSKQQFKLWALKSAGVDTYELEKQILDAKRELVQRDYNEGAAGQVTTDVAQAAASSLDVLKSGGAIGLTAGVGAGAAALALTRSPAAARAAAFRAAALAGKGGAALATFQLETGSAYGELLDAKDDAGKPLDEPVARVAAGIYGTLAAGIEFASWGPMLRAMGPVGELIKTGNEKAAIAALAKDTGFRALAKRWAKNWAGSAGSEGAEEFLQQATQDAVQYFAKSVSQGHLSAKGEVDVEKDLMAGQKGLVGGMGLGAAEIAIDATTHVLLSDRAQVAREQVDALSKAAESPTVKASPAAAARVVADITAKTGQPVTHVYVDPKAFISAALAAKSDPYQTAVELLGDNGPAQLRDALEQGGRLEVPVGDYLEKWSKHAMAAALLEHTTTGPTVPTPAEAQVRPTEAAPAEAPEASRLLAQRLEDQANPVDRGAEYYVDPVSGLRNRRAFDETPAPAGKQLAVITSPDVKGINDHPTAGGHDTANELLRAMGAAVGAHDATAARSGTNFLLYVNDQAELDQVLARVRQAVGPDVALESGLGPDKSQAFAALTTNVETGRALGDVAPRGQASPSLDVGALKFPEGKAASTAPAELAAKLRAMTPAEYFQHAYVTKGGLLTAEGFRALPRKAHTVSFDVRGLGAANGTFGLAAGDKLLAAFEAAVRKAGGADVDAAHLSGDEFAAQADDRAALEAFVARVRQHLEGIGVTGRNKATGEVQTVPVQFRHGLGADYAQADRALNAARRAEEAGGAAPGDRAGGPQSAAAVGADARAAGHHEERPAGVGRESGAGPLAGRDRRQAHPGEVVASPFSAEVEQQQRAMGLLPMFRSAAEAGMNGEQWRAYLEHQREASSHGARVAELAAAKDSLREAEAWWRQQLAKEREAAEREFEQLPARRAALFLRGRDPAAAFPVGLQRAAVVAAVGEEAARRVPTRGDGVHPDELADMFGYATGAAMVKEIAALPDKAAWSKATAAARMAEKYPAVVEDRRAFRAIVDEGLHGPFTEKWLIDELSALGARSHALVFNPEANRMQAVPNALLGRPQAPADAARTRAREIADAKPINRLDAGVVLRQERAAADAALKAAARGDHALAYVEKQQQLLNMYLFRELTDARAQRERFLALAGELVEDKARARLGKASPVYRDGADLVLEAIGEKNPEQREQPLASLGEVTAQLDADGSTVGFDVEVLGRLVAKPKPAAELTVAQMREVDAFLRNVRAAARSKTNAIVDGKDVDQAKVLAELAAEAEKNRRLQGPVASSQSAETPFQTAQRLWNEFDGSLLRPERMASWLGGNDLGSTWFRAVVKPLQDAKAFKAGLMKKTAAPIVEALERALKDARFMGKIDGAQLFPTHRTDVAAPSHVFELLMMALHMGTESNKDRLLDGRGITEQQVTAAIDKHLWKEAVELVQTIWDANESLWTAAQALEERDSGLAPPKLERSPLKTAHGDLRGGYMPAKYDLRIEAVGERQEGQALSAVLDPSYVRPGTARSHLKQRTEGFTGALSLEPGLIPRHLDQVVHDIAYREALKSVAGLIFNPALRKVMNERIGAGKADQFRQWLRDVGTQNGAQLADLWSNIGRGLRKRTVVAALAYRVPTALGDLSNYVIGARRIGPAAMAAGMAEALTTGGKAFAFADSKSGELRSRQGQMLERFHADVALLTKRGGRVRQAFSSFARHGFTVYEWTERFFAVPAWLGAYRSALKGGKTDADAVTYADAMVRRMLPAWNPVDQAGVQRNRYLAPFLTFYSWHSTIYAEVRDEFEPVLQAAGIVDAAKKAPAAVAASLAIIFSSYVLGELLSGRGPEPGDGDDDEERWLRWFTRKMLSGAVQPLPFGGDVASAVESRVLHKHVNPRAGLFTAVIDPAVHAAEKMLDGDAEAEDQFFALVRAVGPLTGMPTYPLTGPGKYALDVAQGDQQPRGPGDVVGGALYGAREGQPANIPTLLQDLAGE